MRIKLTNRHDAGIKELLDFCGTHLLFLRKTGTETAETLENLQTARTF